MTRSRLKTVHQKASEYFGKVEISELAAMCRDPVGKVRLLALALMRKQIAEGESPLAYFSLACGLIADADNDCRWQALIVVGELIGSYPQEVWQVVADYGDHPDEDMRTGVACVLLEHLLEEHFEECLPRVRAKLLEGSPLFADMVRTCWFDGQEGPRFRRVQNLMRKAARGRYRLR